MYRDLLVRGKEWVLDALFPPTCQLCGKDGAWTCAPCIASLPLSSHDQPDPPPGARSFLSLGLYAEPAWRTLLMTLKYQSASCLEPVFVELLKRWRRERHEAWPWAHETSLIVTQIPGDKKRVHTRGLDHTALLARCVRRVLVPWADTTVLLSKQRATLSNASLPADVRRTLNVKDAFHCNTTVAKPVLLVDDVYTTGATIQEAIRALTAAGCSRIYVVTFARSLRTDRS